MLQRFVIFVIAMFALLGCSLMTETVQTALPTATQAPPPTAFALPTASPTTAPVPTATTRPADTPLPVANRPCLTRNDWPLYVVVAGDTLADIARRSASTVNDLAVANCINNANNIYVGQQLRVPRTPATATPKPANTPQPVPTSMDNAPRILSFHLATEVNPPRLEWYTWNAGSVVLSVSGPRGAFIGYGALPANSTFTLPELGMEFAPYATFTLTLKDYAGRDVIGPNGLPMMARQDVHVGDAPLDCPTLNNAGSGDLWVSPILGLDNRCSYVRPNQTIWVTWDGMQGLTAAEFYFLPVAGSVCGTPGNPNVIGTDRNMADGNSITWYVGPGPCAGVLYAFGYTDTTMIESRQHALVIYNR